jgi:hypothetical protein
MLNQNDLLMHRYARFCRAAPDVNRFHKKIRESQQTLHNEYSDAVERYERLVSIILERDYRIREQEVNPITSFLIRNQNNLLSK